MVPTLRCMMLLPLAIAPATLRAQCAGGAPPPCPESSVIGELPARQAAALAAYNSGTLLRQRGDSLGAADSLCTALAILPERAATWSAPSGCVVFLVATRVTVVGTADSILSAVRRSGAQLRSLMPGWLGPGVHKYRYVAQGPGLVAVTVVSVDQVPRVIAVFAEPADFRRQLRGHIERAMVATTHTVAGN